MNRGNPLRGYNLILLEGKNMQIPHNWHLNSDGSYDVEGDVNLTAEYVSDGKLAVKFGKVTGTFNARGIGLTTLEGLLCARKVGQTCKG